MSLRSGYLIVGLGNPGPDYEGTRHNIGFEVVDAVAGNVEVTEVGSDRTTHWARTVFQGPEGGEEEVVLAKPLTFMNRSGVAVAALLEACGVELEQLLVVVDDFNLPLGRLRVRPGGSSGGHNGLKSVAECLGTTDFPRLRLGIGSTEGQIAGDVIDFVLGRFAPEEEEAVALSVRRAAALAEDWIWNGLDYCQERYNRAAETLTDREEMH